jgi:isopenicillin N synthase-like dioxygenase
MYCFYCPTSPFLGAYLVNLGDMMARWSNDVYKSTEHRVFNYSSKARHSAPFFCNCDFDAVVEPILTNVTTVATKGTAYAGSSIGGADASATFIDGREAREATAKYPPIQAGQYIMQKLGLMWET